MNFESNEEQRLLTESVRRFLDKDYDFEKRRKIIASAEGWDADAWTSLADMGVTALALPSDHGGFDGGAVDLMGIMEAFGAGLLVEPFLPTVLAARLVALAGDETQQGAILPRVAAGELRLAFAHLERGARFDLSRVSAEAKADGNAWTVSGDKRAVVGAPMAGKLVVSARMPGGGLGLFVVDTQDAALTLRITVDGMRAADVLLDNAKAELLGDGTATLEKIEAVNDFGTALVCAEAVGAMKFACDTTLDYLKTRKQFGVTIGSFQALQHRMVDMFVASELSRSMTCLACSKADTGDANERARAVSAAKIKICDSARLISQESVQLHGGMGMTEELKVSHTFRRLNVIMEQFGDDDYHLTRFAALEEA